MGEVRDDTDSDGAAPADGDAMTRLEVEERAEPASVAVAPSEPGGDIATPQSAGAAADGDGTAVSDGPWASLGSAPPTEGWGVAEEEDPAAEPPEQFLAAAETAPPPPAPPTDDGFERSVEAAFAEPGAAAAAEADAPPSQSYRPAAIALVEEIDRLTRERARRAAGDTDGVIAERERRIEELAAELAAAPRPVPGEVILGVRLDRILGHGATGPVWRGTDVTTGASRAVKLFDLDLCPKGLALHQFRRGARAMEHLGAQPAPSTAVIRVRSDEARLAYAMDLVEAGDLSKVAQFGWSRLKKVAVFERICHAVRYAHDHHVLHRCLKPANVLVRADGTPVVTDFDLADVGLLRASSGTWTSFVAPELLGGRDAREAATDLFGLGRLLHFMLLEREPTLLVEETPSLSELIGQPQGLIRIIRKCTARDPAKRYQSVEELLEDLEHHDEKPGVVGSAVAPERAASTLRATTTAEGEEPRTGRWLAAAVLVVVGVGGMIAWRSAIEREGLRGEAPSAIATRRRASGPGRAAVGTEEPSAPSAATPSRGATSRAVATPAVVRDPTALGAGQGSVEVVSENDGSALGATVWIDGRSAGIVPFSTPLGAGRHTVEVRRTGFGDYSGSVDVEAGAARTLRVALTGERIPGSISVRLTLDDLAGGELWIDGTPRGRVPTKVEGLDEGDHAIEVRLGMLRPWTAKVHVDAGRETVVAVGARLPYQSAAP